MKNKIINKDSIEIVSWKSNFKVAIFILSTNQKKEVKEKAYQELMRGADLLDKAYNQQKGGK
jgi:endonuclease III